MITDQEDIACTKPEAKRKVSGESHEGWASCILLRTDCEADLHMDDSMNELIVGGGV